MTYDRLKSREITFQLMENLAKAGVSDGLQISHEHKRYYYTFDNSYYLLRAFRTPTQIFPR